ncbi:hypothetical protein BD414DRAFT_492143 [Trametes punicea]|nr:hypothetical protein BD414DRAFT_492143 [Trametes punicea]
MEGRGVFACYIVADCGHAYRTSCCRCGTECWLARYPEQRSGGERGSLRKPE